MATLIITLPATPGDAATLYDYLLSANGASVSEQSCAPLALLPPADEVVALVPSRKLSWQQVSLPQGSLGRRFFQEGSATRLRAVLEGLLEDRLLDEPSQLHFALEPAPRCGAPVWVAVCERAWLHAALQALEQAGRPVARIVPEFTPGALADSLYVLGEANDAHLVFTERGGVAIWPLSASSVALLRWPETAGIVAEPAVAALTEQLFKRSVTLQQMAQRQLQAIESSWDLAQFDLVSSSRARSWKRWSTTFASLARAPRWRAARMALLALLAINLAGLNAWAWKEQASINAQRIAIGKVLTSTFPKVRVVVDAPLQMGREVAALQRSSGTPSGGDLETLLALMTAVVPPNARPNSIEFTNGELRLKGLTLGSEAISQISFRIKPQGYVATMEGDSLVVKQWSAP